MKIDVSQNSTAQHSLNAATLGHSTYFTKGGVRIHRCEYECDYYGSMKELRESLDSQRGVLLSSSYEYPGRYNRWDIGFCNPPLVIEAKGLAVEIRALNARGKILIPEILRALEPLPAIRYEQRDCSKLRLHIERSKQLFTEEERSRQPSVFSIVRALVSHFYSDDDSFLGLYGAFGYELRFQFESLDSRRLADGQARDLVLYLPDELIVSEHQNALARRIRYDFICRGLESDNESLGARETTGGLSRTGESKPYVPASGVGSSCDHKPGEYAQTVRKAKERFASGDLFEVVPGQVFSQACHDRPSQVFERLRQNNPAPYGALMNLGEQEYLVSASPEMFVRVRGNRVETCPISGTIARGEDALGDERQIRTLLNSEKEEAELSMCTDVDRNDKSRVCVPGSVQLIGRRQVELYSRLIHTVDHVVGNLAPGFDALDAFLAHTWAVTVTGAPKQAAIQFIEDNEKSARYWYGGAMGCIGFNGNLNTGLTLRSARIKDGVAQVRVGATLLSDSDPLAEEEETRLKASAVLAAINPPQSQETDASIETLPLNANMKILMVDHRDSFVHNLSAYLRETGATVTTMRPELARQSIARDHYDLVVMSPGPGKPQDFDTDKTLQLCQQYKRPVFGVCLGLQAIVEYCGGSLRQLDEPMHGKPSHLSQRSGPMFENCSSDFIVGRYHSLCADKIPASLQVQARTEDGVVMAIEHESLPWMAVQFHPESIMSLGGQNGKRLICNVVQYALLHKAASVERNACAS
ncbi:MAG: anthranilate synthase component I [Pseudohongiellaceae bacterium]|nr:anthranilate synthase component I [Pseudohongiellaceae bacterium]